jgi:hypothetical protein
MILVVVVVVVKADEGGKGVSHFWVARDLHLM